KRILALSSGLWKSSKVNSSCVQPSHASDSHSPHRSYSFCFFCGLSGHIRAGCHSYKSYLALGKCLLVNGRVVLPTGQEIPREVAGRTLRDRLDNWSSLASHVFDTPARIPAQTSIVSTRSLPTLQLEPAVPNPTAIPSRCSSAERSRSSPHAQPQSRWPHTQGELPSHRHSRSHSQTRKGSYIRSKDEFIPVQSYSHSLKQHHARSSSLPSSSSSSSRSHSCSYSRKAHSFAHSKPKRSRSHSRTPRRSRRAR
ncbi:hypothetical protein M404DRAFT_997608, partial [Pisolithus tinctorius Marx 270]